jgi:hypothetical protein
MLDERRLARGALAMLILLLSACSESRNVDVSGVVDAPADESVTGPITVDFGEVTDGGTRPKPVLSLKLDAPSGFTETVNVSGDKLHVSALVDENGDGRCTDGELWAEADTPINHYLTPGLDHDDGNDSADSVALTLARAACP